MQSSIRSISDTDACLRPSGIAEAVVWDFGDVLVRWQPHLAVADRWNQEEFNDLAKRAQFDAINALFDDGVDTDLSELRARDPEAAELWDGYIANMPAALEEAVEGSEELVKELADGGIPQYGLTNWNALLAPSIPQIVPGARLLRGYVVSGLEGVTKPDQRIFDILFERFGIDPSTTLFVDDREVNTQAAAAAGFITHTFTTARSLRQHMARLGLPVHS